MSNITENNEFDIIDFTKASKVDLFVAQILCNMKDIHEAQAKRDLQRMRKSLEASTVNGEEEVQPVDLTVTGPSRTSPAVTRSHKGNFTCRFRGCFKTFATSKYLNQHEVSHQPAQHPCTLCVPPKRFRRRAALVQHRRTRHLCKPYSCDYANCSKAFKDSKRLEKHRRQEHSKCFFCGEGFQNSAGLKLHLKKCRVLEEEKAAGGNNDEWKEYEQGSRPSSASSGDHPGEWSMSTTFNRSPSTGTSGYSS